MQMTDFILLVSPENIHGVYSVCRLGWAWWTERLPSVYKALGSFLSASQTE